MNDNEIEKSDPGHEGDAPFPFYHGARWHEAMQRLTTAGIPRVDIAGNELSMANRIDMLDDWREACRSKVDELERERDRLLAERKGIKTSLNQLLRLLKPGGES